MEESNPGIIPLMFDAMIKPILVYGNDAWATKQQISLWIRSSYILLDGSSA